MTGIYASDPKRFIIAGELTNNYGSCFFSIKLIFSGLHSSWLIPFQRFSIKCTSPYFGNLVFIHTRWIRPQSWWQGSQFKSTHLMSATGQCSYKIQTVQFKSFQFSCEDKCINSLWKSLFLPYVGVLRHRTPHD